ncbi:SSL2 DNA or RNA helicases of superfamily II [uncultured Caudovirales phage]|uniref:SSL2 DNA or RNA helicases of superfamily II n=1 Tax=uncultured Caudovirales phage TaxID=2100421 RepID=A0A6J5N3N5_9CAUD|nr:SSL2 DNA or RNA helicases of superfamily II [uncultured Caudovirales phage]
MELYPYQKDAIDALWAAWRVNPQGVELLVVPTGGGKSLIIAEVIRQITKKHPKFKFLVATHTKEIVSQNARELQGRLMQFGMNEAIGVYSASLSQKTIRRVTFCNVQSVYRKASEFEFDMLILDECHLVSQKDSSMYQQLITSMRDRNRNLKVMGLTATPMRMDQGSLLSEGSTFTDIAYEIPIRRLIDEGYLSPLISVAKSAVDISNVRMSGNEYNQHELELAFNQDYLIENQCKEIINAAGTRNKWLIFCAGINHANRFATILSGLGVSADYVSGDMPAFDRDLKIDNFKSGKIKALCNVNVLTTGFNVKPIDVVVLARATKSVSLYIQMVGRGTRTSPGKENCLVLDFGGNIDRHGPIDLIQIKAKRERRSEVESLPTKKCPECGCVVHIKVTACPSCEFVFPPNTNELTAKPSSEQILSAPEELKVIAWSVSRHKKTGKPDSLKITYSTEAGNFNEFLCFDHGGMASQMARKKWWDKTKRPNPSYAAEWMGNAPEKKPLTPISVDSAIVRVDEFLPVVSIRVIKREKFHEILHVRTGLNGTPRTTTSGDIYSAFNDIEPIKDWDFEIT